MIRVQDSTTDDRRVHKNAIRLRTGDIGKKENELLRVYRNAIRLRDFKEYFGKERNLIMDAVKLHIQKLEHEVEYFEFMASTYERKAHELHSLIAHLKFMQSHDPVQAWCLVTDLQLLEECREVIN